MTKAATRVGAAGEAARSGRPQGRGQQTGKQPPQRGPWPKLIEVIRNGPRQQELRSASASLAPPRSQPAHRTVPGSIPLPTMRAPLGRASGAFGAHWSRPMGSSGCSMVARMHRYGPAPSGIRSAAQIRAAGQNGSSRHVLALFDSSSRRINEQSSGLLIRGFGVRVPGGASVLTTHYTRLL
jgi:hypothetical protein